MKRRLIIENFLFWPILNNPNQNWERVARDQKSQQMWLKFNGCETRINKAAAPNNLKKK